MIATALDHLAAPPSSKLLGWHLLDARPREEGRLMAEDGAVLATATASARLVEAAKALRSAALR